MCTTFSTMKVKSNVYQLPQPKLVFSFTDGGLLAQVLHQCNTFSSSPHSAVCCLCAQQLEDRSCCVVRLESPTDRFGVAMTEMIAGYGWHHLMSLHMLRTTSVSHSFLSFIKVSTLSSVHTERCLICCVVLQVGLYLLLPMAGRIVSHLHC